VHTPLTMIDQDTLAELKNFISTTVAESMSNVATKDDLVVVTSAIAGLKHQMDERFDAVDRRFEGIDARLDAIDLRLDGMDVRFVGIDARLDKIDTRLDEHDEKLDAILDALGDRLAIQDEQLNEHAAMMRSHGIRIHKLEQNFR